MSRVFGEDTRILLSELQTREARKVWPKIGGGEFIRLRQVVDTAGELEWNGLLFVLHEEAGQVVTLKEGVDVVGTVGEVGDVDARVGVDAVGVAGRRDLVHEYIGQQCWQISTIMRGRTRRIFETE